MSTTKPTILIVDDEPDILELIEYNLKKEGYQVYTATNGQQAVAEAKKVIPDSLESALRKYINEGDSIKPAVVINADSSAQWGEVVRVMKVARRLGATTSATVSGNE